MNGKPHIHPYLQAVEPRGLHGIQACLQRWPREDSQEDPDLHDRRLRLPSPSAGAARDPVLPPGSFLASRPDRQESGRLEHPATGPGAPLSFGVAEDMGRRRVGWGSRSRHSTGSPGRAGVDARPEDGWLLDSAMSSERAPRVPAAGTGWDGFRSPVSRAWSGAGGLRRRGRDWRSSDDRRITVRITAPATE